MKIKTKILLVLFLFILIITIMGMTYYWLNNKQVGYFNTTEQYLTSKELLKAASTTFSEQVKAYDYYVYLNENSEKHTFGEKKSDLLEKLSIDDETNIDGLDEIRDDLDELNRVYNRSLGIIQKHNKDRAIQETDEDVVKKVDALKEKFSAYIANTEEKLVESRRIAFSYREKVTLYSIIIFGAGLLVLSLLSFNLYKTIINPLKTVETAAQVLGQGNLDYKIEIKSNNEFQNIANSINQMATDLKEFHLQVTQMGKMAAIGELAGGVAHEINNPLTGILGNIQLLLKQVPEDNKMHDKLKKMERASIRCRDIVADLLDFSRRDKAEMESLDINKVIEDTFTFCETEVNSKNIEILKEYTEKLPEVKVSNRTIQQAFLNIINNAIQAMSKGGKLTVATKLNAMKDHVVIQFTDTGHGFDDAVGKSLFDPFFTTKEVGEGTGMGLSLTYRIIKNHKGYINADSTGKDKGAKFTIGLPLEK